MKLRNPDIFLWLTLLVAVVAMGGSLFFSDVANYLPCKLCWYQRICMYSLIPIIVTGLVRKDRSVYMYVLPLGIIGFAIALWQNIEYYLSRLLPQSVTNACSLDGASCTAHYINWLGFITIPMLSFVGFTAVCVLMVLYRDQVKSSVKHDGARD